MHEEKSIIKIFNICQEVENLLNFSKQFKFTNKSTTSQNIILKKKSHFYDSSIKILY
jgi:hypothetical protein